MWSVHLSHCDYNVYVECNVDVFKPFLESFEVDTMSCMYKCSLTLYIVITNIMYTIHTFCSLGKVL